MFRKIFPVFAALCILTLLAACGRKGEEALPGEPTPTVTHAAKVPTTEPSPTPTTEPSPTPTVSIEDMLAKSGELRGIVFPDREAAKVASGALVNNAEKERIAYGVSWSNPLTVRDAFKPGNARYPRLEGMKIDDGMIKVNARISEVADAMLEDSYYPDFRGLAEVLQEFGKPGVEMDYKVTLNREGVFSVCLYRTWRWKEEATFDFLSQAGDYMRERWPEDDDRFTTHYEYLEADADGKALVRMFFQATETVGLTFNLCTGEEMQMADLFAEGTNYLSYINGELGKIYRDDYLYGPLLKNGLVTISDVNGAENFYLVDNGETVDVAITGKLHGGDAKVALTDAIGIEAPWRLFQDVSSYVFRPLGALVTTDWTHETAKHPIVGRLTFQPEGGETVSVAVRWPKKNALWLPTLGADQSNRIDKWLTESKLTEMAKQVVRTCPSEYFRDGREFNLTFESAALFPNGYSNFRFYLGDVGDEYVWRAIEVWVKDGKCITTEELFDTSYEQILTEMFTGLHYSHDPARVTAEEAAAAAKILVPYFRFDYTEDFFGAVQPDQLHWEMIRFEEYEYRYDGRAFAESVPTAVRENLPEALRNDLIFETYVVTGNLEMTDPLVLWKHLRMYEGCKFGK